MGQNNQALEKASYSISLLPPQERPRERLMRCGPEALSSAELLAIVLGSGTKHVSVLQLSQQLLTHFGSLYALAEASLAELCQLKGIGEAKALQIRAAMSLGLRAIPPAAQPRYKIEHPLHAYHFLKEALERETREVCTVLLRDIKGGVISQQIVAIGGLSSATLHPREVFHPAIRHCAATVILAHNHPSGDPTPSSEDIAATKALIAAGTVVGIPLHDHLIIARQGFISLRQQGLLAFE